MIPIPLQVTCYDRGPGGTFTRQNPVSLAGRLTSYEDAIDARGGFKSLRVSFACSAAELKEWLDAGLMREVRAFTPRGRLRWEGVLVELKATIGPIVITRSLDDMANSFVVSYGSDSGNRGATSVYSNLTSIAEYGTKQLAHDLSTTTAAGAANWAQTELKKAAWPQRSRETSLTTDTGGGISIELRAIGRYDLLDWLLTSNTSTATAVTTTQAVSLLTSYNATNTWFSTSSANVVASGHSDTQYIDPNTSYLEKLETLLSQGNSSQNALAWGIYEDGTLYVNVWAGATPSAVSYYRDARDRTVRDSAGNIVEPWDVLPDAMVEDVALISMAEDASAIATETREYVARVGLKISSSGIDLTMEPDALGVTSPKALADAVQNPAGKGAIDRSARASKIGRVIKKDTRTIHPSSDNPQTPVLTGGGTIDTGGGDIVNTGGGNIDLGTGSGIGGSGSLDETIDDRVAALLQAGNLITLTYNDAGNTLTIAVQSLSETIDDRVAALLQAGVGISLTYNDAGNTLTIDADASAPPDARYWVATANATLTNETNLGALSSGLLKQSVASGVATPAIAVAGTDYAAASHTHTSTDITNFNEAVDDRVDALLVAGSGITLTYNDAGNTLTIAASGGLSGSGASGRLALWSGASALTSNAGLTFDGELHAPGRIRAEGGSAGIGLDDRDGSGQWLLYVDGNGFYVSSTITGGTNLLGVTSGAITPASGSGVDLGSGGNKFATMYGTTLNLGGNQVVGSRRTGWSLPSGTVSRATFVTGTATVTDVAQRLAALLNDLSAHGLIGS